MSELWTWNWPHRAGRETLPSHRRVQTGCGVHPAFHANGVFFRVKRLERVTDRSRLPGAEKQGVWNSSTLPYVIMAFCYRCYSGCHVQLAWHQTQSTVKPCSWVLNSLLCLFLLISCIIALSVGGSRGALRAACREAVGSVWWQAGRFYLSPFVEMFQARAFGGPIVIITLSLPSGYRKVPAKSVLLSSGRSLTRILLRSTFPPPHSLY
jgi:hypothetical protein